MHGLGSRDSAAASISDTLASPKMAPIHSQPTLLAAPVIAATFITDLVFGMLNRVAPQLNAYFLAMPVKAVAGVIMALVAFIPFTNRLEYYTVWVLDAVDKTVRHLAGG